VLHSTYARGFKCPFAPSPPSSLEARLWALTGEGPLRGSTANRKGRATIEEVADQMIEVAGT
jgi:hypothetical protein